MARFIEGLDRGRATLLKIYNYGYLNQVQSSRRLERECQRNIELIWRTGRLMPDFETIADFRKDHGEAIRKVCQAFDALCRRMKRLTHAALQSTDVNSRRSMAGIENSPTTR